jgi:hypothetical protein
MPQLMASRTSKHHPFFYRDGFLFARILGFLSVYLDTETLHEEAKEAIPEAIELLRKSAALNEFFGGVAEPPASLSVNDMDSTELLRNFLLERAKGRKNLSLGPMRAEVNRVTDILRRVVEGAAESQDIKEAYEFLETYSDYILGGRRLG